MEKTFQVEVRAFSFHNPDVGDWLDINQDEIGGLINTYGQYFRDHYTYCSDSNGYWHFQRLQKILETASDEKLQVLTHSGWWVPEPISPRDRISRCIDGRSAAQHSCYDRLLAQFGRKNVR